MSSRTNNSKRGQAPKENRFAALAEESRKGEDNDLDTVLAKLSVEDKPAAPSWSSVVAKNPVPHPLDEEEEIQPAWTMIGSSKDKSKPFVAAPKSAPVIVDDHMWGSNVAMFITKIKNRNTTIGFPYLYSFNGAKQATMANIRVVLNAPKMAILSANADCISAAKHQLKMYGMTPFLIPESVTLHVLEYPKEVEVSAEVDTSNIGDATFRAVDADSIGESTEAVKKILLNMKRNIITRNAVPNPVVHKATGFTEAILREPARVDAIDRIAAYFTDELIVHAKHLRNISPINYFKMAGRDAFVNKQLDSVGEILTRRISSLKDAEAKRAAGDPSYVPKAVNITDEMVREAIRKSSEEISYTGTSDCMQLIHIFETILEKPGKLNIMDCSIGVGQMLAASLLCGVAHYTGCDPSEFLFGESHSVNHLARTINEIRVQLGLKEVDCELRRSGIIQLPDNGTFDLVYYSPPMFAKYTYADFGNSHKTEWEKEVDKDHSTYGMNMRSITSGLKEHGRNGRRKRYDEVSSFIDWCQTFLYPSLSAAMERVSNTGRLIIQAEDFTDYIWKPYILSYLSGKMKYEGTIIINGEKGEMSNPATIWTRSYMVFKLGPGERTNLPALLQTALSYQLEASAAYKISRDFYDKHRAAYERKFSTKNVVSDSDGFVDVSSVNVDDLLC